MSHQETVPPEQQQEQQQADDLEVQVPDPEVVPKAKRVLSLPNEAAAYQLTASDAVITTLCEVG